MARPASKPAVESLSLIEVVGIAFIGLIEGEVDLGGRPADPVRHQTKAINRGCERGIETQLPFLSFAARQSNGCEENN
jgi:hypothetical protein